MINFLLIEGFDWDAGNARKSADKHAVSQGEAEQVFFNDPLLILEDDNHRKNEIRLHALGRTNTNRLLHISFTLRNAGRLIRIISARSMSRRERVYYEKKD